MLQKFRTKGICTNGEIIDYVNEHVQKLKDILCHAWSEEDEEIEPELSELETQDEQEKPHDTCDSSEVDVLLLLN